MPSLVNVYRMNLIETEVPDVFCDASDNGGVQLTLFDVEYESELPRIKPEALPQLYFNWCLNVDAFSEMVKVCAVPSVPLATESVLFRGIVVSVYDADATTVPLLTPDANDAEHDSVFVPSEL